MRNSNREKKLKSEEFIILEDLKEFIEKRSDICIDLGDLYDTQYFRVEKQLYAIDGGWVWVCSVEPQRIVSLFDPQYREKFLAHLKGQKMEVNRG